MALLCRIQVLPQGGPEEVPNPTGLLSSSLPSSAIEEPNTAISSARQEETREQGPHLKLGNEIKDIGSSRKDRKLVVHPSPPRKEPEIRLKAVQTPVDSIKPAAKEVKAATKVRVNLWLYPKYSNVGSLYSLVAIRISLEVYCRLGV